MLGKSFHIGIKAFNEFLVLFNLFGEITKQIVLQAVLLTLVVRLHQLQTSNIHIQVHLFFDTLVACTQSLDFRIGKCGFINVVASSHRRFARHNLRDKLLLVLQGLPQVRIEGCLRHITVNVNFWIHVALTNDTTGTLFKVAGSPGCIKVVESDKSVLDVHTGSHLKGRTHQNTNLSRTDFTEQFLFTSFGVRLVDESNLFSRNTTLHQFVSDVVIDGETLFFLRAAVLFCKMLQCSDFRAIKVSCGSFGSSLGRCVFRCAQIAEHELGQLVSVTVLPNAMNVIHAHIDLACRFIGKVGVNDTLVETELATV